jgi:hypothetical protein
LSCGHEKKVLELKVCLKCNPQKFLAAMDDLMERFQELVDPDGELKPEVVQRLEKISKAAGLPSWFARMAEAVSDEEAARSSAGLRELAEPVEGLEEYPPHFGGLPTASEFLELRSGDTVTVETVDGEPVGFGVREAADLELRSPPAQVRCRCCNRRLKDGESVAAGEGPLCREGLCKRKTRVS